MKKIVLLLISVVMISGLMTSGVYVSVIPGTYYLEKYYYDFATDVDGCDYAVYITAADSSSVSFYFEYRGSFYSPIYTTMDIITVELNGNHAEFEWKDSWENSGIGWITINKNSVDLYAKTTEWAEMNRGCMDTNFTGANSDGSFTFPSVENTGTVYSLIHNSVSESTAEDTSDSGISVYINGNFISFAQAPYIENGTTMVPMRAIFEELGAEVDYNGETKTITAVKGEKKIILTVGSKDAYVNGSVFTL